MARDVLMERRVAQAGTVQARKLTEIILQGEKYKLLH